ncbi:MAG: 16S rRNA (guanine(527)-N(7))-methyltransferase RsmG [Defluviitaleaceae bacterium]|nr:16S rRNA (guanine(527)-N(7))-methyltransferase RsmG [Defluviitaleaceae bacterium]
MDKIFEEHGILINRESAVQLEFYMDLLLSWNEKMNLTTITNREEIVVKHFLDSLMLLKFEEIKGQSLIDIGTGAGFPGLVLKIAENSLNTTLMDSLSKRLVFLNEVISKLGLENIKLNHSRAEDLAHDFDLRESFDIAASRAVAKVNTLCEYALPYVKIGGIFVAYKGPEYSEELKEAASAIETLGGELERVEEFKIKEHSRSLIFIRKLSQTPPNYPRKSNTIAKKPII